MNPARLLMPTSPARVTASPRRIGARQIQPSVTPRLTQTRLLIADERRAMARIRFRRAGRRLRRRVPERL